MKEVLAVALVSVFWSLRPIGSDTVQFNTAAVTAVPEQRRINDVGESLTSVDSGVDSNGTSLCDRYLRSAEVEVRSPRNHKFVTSNGWTERQRPRPEINVYSRVEELPQPSAQPSTSTFYQQQRDSAVYHDSRRQQLQPTVRTSKRIIYYATLPDVVRPPAGYPATGHSGGYPSQPSPGYSGGYPAPQPGYSGQYTAPPSRYSGRLPAPPPAGYPGGPPSPPPGYPSGLPSSPSGYPSGLPSSPSGYSGGYPASPSRYSADPYAIGPNPVSADFRQLEPNRNSPDNLQRNRVAPHENVYNGGGASNGGAVTSVTTKTTAVYNSRYDEPAEFRDSFFRPNEFSSKFASWSEPFYKSWSSSPWEKETTFGNSKGPSSFSWDREPLGEGGAWDDAKRPSWENRGSSWEKELVEVPLKKPNNVMGNGGSNFNNDRYPEVAVVQSEVIDVSGNGQQNKSPPPPLPSYEIIDVDPKPYHQQQPQQSKPTQNTRYDPPPSRTRYTPMQPPVRFEQHQPPRSSMRYEQQQQPPSSKRYDQQRRPPPPSSSSTQYGQQNQINYSPSNGYYENIKNNINAHQFMTSWTEVSTQDGVLPTHSVSLDITTFGNSTNVKNNTRIIPYTNSTNTPTLL
ncbi:Hypothetical protein CINCED_3A021847 [Cinara cedri]|uniref:Uncharacterized protein n=1 Tax=Cinara cedri TaxID=506608 RepID=A0A5E4NMV7_9HEMI|nr:Hypothetical protein CINCED_3A021847 [Cinara cedri]